MKNNPPLQMIRCMSLKKHTNTGGYNGTDMCSRRFVYYSIVTENYCSLVGIFWKTEVISKLYYVRSAVENVGGSVVDMFWKSEVIDKLYDVWSADENVGGLVVDILEKRKKLASCTTCGPPTKRGCYGGCFVFYLGVRYIFCCELSRQGGQSWRACSIWVLVYVDIYMILSI